MAIIIEIPKEELHNKTSERSKVYWITINVLCNGMGASECGIEYDWLRETKTCAKGQDYFPNLSWEQFIDVARKYQFWLDFEKNLYDTGG